MTERPIIFSAPMVRAILAGTKTQTRRIVKAQPGPEWRLHKRATATFVMPGSGTDTHSPMFMSPRCPYGQPGGRLWVREAFAHVLDDKFGPVPDSVIYRADEGNSDWPHGWRPSIHMPRCASRILLEITAVRVERLNDITRGDAMAEGCPFPNMASGPDPREWYAGLWDEINCSGSWAANPWVWVVEFKRVR